MGTYLNPGPERFKRSRASKIYVDKSALINFTNSVLGTEQQYLCVSRPRRFGKSMAADMLAAYYCHTNDVAGLFAGLKITSSASFAEHAGKYDVIKLDLRTFFDRGESIALALATLENEIRNEVAQAYPQIPDLQSFPLFKAVSQVFSVTKRPFVIIIDEWDCPFRDREHDVAGHEMYLDFLRGWFKDKPYIALAYITGILPVKKYNTQSALNTFWEYSIIDPGDTAPFYGFTEEEVQDLCVKYTMDFSACKAWYDGYQLKGISSIYNPNSVVEALLRKEYKPYWGRTGAAKEVTAFVELDLDDMRGRTLDLIAGLPQEIYPNRFANDLNSVQDSNDALTCLVHLGYLTYTPLDYARGTVAIPNKEIRTQFEDMVRFEKDWSRIAKALKASSTLLDATLAGDTTAVAAGIESVHDEFDMFQYNGENALSCVLALAFYTARTDFAIFRETPTGKGRTDLIFIPFPHAIHKPALVVELKWNKSSQGAIQQIKDKNYPAALKGWDGKVLLVGINYDAKTKKHDCIIESIDI